METEPPFVLVSSAALAKLKPKRGRAEGLLTLPTPDKKMIKSKTFVRPTDRRSQDGTLLKYDNAEMVEKNGMLTKDRCPWYHPLNEFSMDSYRANWDPSGENCDHGRAKKDWKDNPRRFALVGRPQIGKTGVFLHLIYLLHRHLGITAPDDRELLDDDSTESDEPDEPVMETAKAKNMGPHPDIKVMRSAIFDDANTTTNDQICKSCSCFVEKDGSPKNGFEPLAPPRKFGGCEIHAPGCGKCESANCPQIKVAYPCYAETVHTVIADGDAKIPEIWRYYVDQGGRPGAHGAPDAGKYSTKKSPVLQVPVQSTAAPAASGGAHAEMTGAETTNTSPGEASTLDMRTLATAAAAIQRYRSQDGEILRRRIGSSRTPTSNQYAITFFGCMDAFENSVVKETTGKLHVPDDLFLEGPPKPWSNGQRVAPIWRKTRISCEKRGECDVSLALDHGGEDGQYLRFPIFTPSHQRFAPGPTQAKLDIRTMMGETTYAQIVAVKPSEVEAYKEQFPFHVFFELPPEADKLAIGCSRYYMKQLGHILRAGSDLSSPLCFVSDDNVDYWNGITLTGDPHPQFSADALPDKMRLHSVRQSKVLRHFSEDTDTYKASDFAILGFGKLRTKGTVDPDLGLVSGVRRTNAYKHGHVYSAYILNLDKLEDVEYGRKHFCDGRHLVQSESV